MDAMSPSVATRVGMITRMDVNKDSMLKDKDQGFEFKDRNQLSTLPANTIFGDMCG